jgi:hypothetical protein
MNTTALNSIINTIVPAVDQHTVLIDQIGLTAHSLVVGLIHADDEGEIEEEVLKITSDGTITIEGKFQTASDLSVLPLAIREVVCFFLVVLRDNAGEELEPCEELELISANKQFFLDRQDYFVPAGVLYAAGIVDEHNMTVDPTSTPEFLAALEVELFGG